MIIRRSTPNRPVTSREFSFVSEQGKLIYRKPTEEFGSARKKV